MIAAHFAATSQKDTSFTFQRLLAVFGFAGSFFSARILRNPQPDPARSAKNGPAPGDASQFRIRAYPPIVKRTPARTGTASTICNQAHRPADREENPAADHARKDSAKTLFFRFFSSFFHIFDGFPLAISKKMSKIDDSNNEERGNETPANKPPKPNKEQRK
ncbi:MAG: hypothetical protein IJK97_03755 [Thermoguttaceae bacterium]|nr:hypothetical protein [Thermoguttaceae bacterium]